MAGEDAARRKFPAQQSVITWKPPIVALYDSLIPDPAMREYFGPEGDFNFGYWREGIATPARASYWVQPPDALRNCARRPASWA